MRRTFSLKVGHAEGAAGGHGQQVGMGQHLRITRSNQLYGVSLEFETLCLTWTLGNNTTGSHAAPGAQPAGPVAVSYRSQRYTTSLSVTQLTISGNAHRILPGNACSQLQFDG